MRPPCEPLRTDRYAENYAKAIETINADHAKRLGKTTETELAKKIPRPAVVGLARILKERPSPEVSAALLKCGEAALDLAEIDHFRRIRARLLETDKETAAKLGDALAREKFVVRGFGELDEGYLDAYDGIVEAILNAYDEVFGFKEWSKVPGKKIRVRVHLEYKITRPPHKPSRCALAFAFSGKGKGGKPGQSVSLRKVRSHGSLDCLA